MNDIVLQEVIEKKIYLIRGLKVMLDRDLADLYGSETKALNKAVKRNHDRFPPDFMFQLTKDETDSLRFQIDTSKRPGRGGRRYLPYAFTEQGVAMLSSVLNSKRAVKVNIEIMRAFVNLRELLSNHKELAHKLQELEGRVKIHDEEIYAIFDAIRRLMAPSEEKKRKIGFNRERED